MSQDPWRRDDPRVHCWAWLSPLILVTDGSRDVFLSHVDTGIVFLLTQKYCDISGDMPWPDNMAWIRYPTSSHDESWKSGDPRDAFFDDFLRRVVAVDPNDAVARFHLVEVVTRGKWTALPLANSEQPWPPNMIWCNVPDLPYRESE